MLHLLKWKYQPGGRGARWQASIKVQRVAIEDHLGDNPSLKPHLSEALQRAYRTAVLEGVVETSLSESAFPASFPWSFERIMDPDFWPE